MLEKISRLPYIKIYNLPAYGLVEISCKKKKSYFSMLEQLSCRLVKILTVDDTSSGRFKWAMPCENMYSGIWGQPRPRSACAYMQSDQGLHCPLTEKLDTTE